MILRDATKTDWPAILSLNEESVRFLSPMDAAALAKWAEAACYLRVVEAEGQVGAFLLGFRKDADYDSPNFLWFNARFDDFVYIDRVVVAPAFRGRGLADRLYDDFESFARAHNIARITCEVNIEPPNPVSLKFHARRGFEEVGRQPYGPHKIVSLLQHNL
ncbi:MAG TPA: GNAT family N-acetyltransferase [Rhizomicrobium sp.]|nr:GNAT family N-acetyltransferase [Rhizomicrobium sp.]